jgi:hypothetical protein
MGRFGGWGQTPFGSSFSAERDPLERSAVEVSPADATGGTDRVAEVVVLDRGGERTRFTAGQEKRPTSAVQTNSEGA